MTVCNMRVRLPAIRLPVLLFAVFANSLGFEAKAQEIDEPEEPAITESVDIKAYQKALNRIETDEGAYAAALPEQLYSLGLALQQMGQHEEAIEVFKRGIHVTRVNHGLYSLEQIPLILGEISSIYVVGDLDEVDERRAYLLKVQQHSLPSGALLTQALMEQASWQQKAYKLGVGGAEASFAHLQSMWSLYNEAIKDIVVHESANSPSLMEPLSGLLITQYLMATQTEPERANVARVSAQRNQFSNDSGQSYKMGKSIIRSIYEVERERYGENSLPVVKAMVMLGDWLLWNGRRDSAHGAYLDALRRIIKLDDAAIQVERIFGGPVALPDIDGIRSLPQSVAPGLGNVVLQFGVSKYGQVSKVTRLDEVENDGEVVRRLMRRIRKTKFRPRYEGVERVATEKVLRAYDIKQ